MQTKENNPDTEPQDSELNAELAGILTAISIVSRRLARKLTVLSEQGDPTEKGGTPNEQNE